MDNHQAIIELQDRVIELEKICKELMEYSNRLDESLTKEVLQIHEMIGQAMTTQLRPYDMKALKQAFAMLNIQPKAGY